MNRLTFAAIFAFAIACVGCGNSNPLTASPSSISAPSGISSQTTGLSQTTGVIRPARWDDGAWPNPPSDIVWVGPFFSTVRITNKSGQVQDFTMALFDASTGEDHETQHLIRAVTRRFQIGETATFGFDMSDECGSIYQRDVWESGQVGVGRLYAEGGPFLKGRCNGETPPAPRDGPPVVTPPQDGPIVFCHIPPGNPENGQTLSLPLSSILSGHIPQHAGDHLGACVPVVVVPPVVDDTPVEPPVVDVCPNIAGDQSTVPDGKHVNEGGQCVPDEPVISGPPVEPKVLFCHVDFHIPNGGPNKGVTIITNQQDLTLPPSAIYSPGNSGHIPQHALDHLGSCTIN